MKKIEFKKIVTTALIAVMGLFSLATMAQSPNVPIMGVFNQPILVDPLPCVGCPGSTVFTIKNNSKCKEFLKFVIGFKASQDGNISNPFVLPDYVSTIENPLGSEINITNIDISNLLTSSNINTNQPYNLIEGGFDIYYHDPINGISTRMGNLLPGQTITVHYPVNSTNTELCKCYKLSWNEATKTITIDDCI